jgi:hypothetical protein
VVGQLRPDLVPAAVRNARSFTGTTVANLMMLAASERWPGYFGAPRYATATLGRSLAQQRATAYARLALEVPRVGSGSSRSAGASTPDSAADPSKAGRKFDASIGAQVGPAEVMPASLAWLLEGLRGRKPLTDEFRDCARRFNAVSICRKAA